MEFNDLTNECRDKLLSVIETVLDTRDKRYMFMYLEFKKLISNIDLEGSPRQASWNIYSEFQKHSMLGSLIATVNVKFNADIQLETLL